MLGGADDRGDALDCRMEDLTGCLLAIRQVEQERIELARIGMYETAQTRRILDKRARIVLLIRWNKDDVAARDRRKDALTQKESLPTLTHADLVPIVVMQCGYRLAIRQGCRLRIKVERDARRYGDGMKMHGICLFFHDLCTPFP